MKIQKLPLLKAILISLAIHLVLAISVAYVPQTKAVKLVFGQIGSGGKLAGPGDEKFSHFIDRTPIEVDIKLQETIEQKKIKALASENSNIIAPAKPDELELSPPTEECLKDASFGGIGVSFVSIPNKGFIMQILPAYYPAYKAGLRQGDRLLTDLNSIRGESGSFVLIEYERDGNKRSVDVRREKICYAKKIQPHK